MPSSPEGPVKGALRRAAHAPELDPDFSAALETPHSGEEPEEGGEYRERATHNIDAARDAAARNIRRPAYAAIKGVPKARIDVGVVAYASAVIKALQHRMELVQQMERLTDQAYELTITGNGRLSSLSMYLPAGSSTSGPVTLIVPGLVGTNGTPLTTQHNAPERERVALCRPLHEIVSEALAPDQTWNPDLAPYLRQICVQPATPAQSIEIALRSLTYARHVQRVLERESLRPLFYLQEAESAAPHTSRQVLALRAEERLERQFPHLNRPNLPDLTAAAPSKRIILTP